MNLRERQHTGPLDWLLAFAIAAEGQRVFVGCLGASFRALRVIDSGPSLFLLLAFQIWSGLVLLRTLRRNPPRTWVRVVLCAGHALLLIGGAMSVGLPGQVIDGEWVVHVLWFTPSAVAIVAQLLLPAFSPDKAGRCATCGYLLKGLPGPNCPECGKRLPSPHRSKER